MIFCSFIYSHSIPLNCGWRIIKKSLKQQQISTMKTSNVSKNSAENGNKKQGAATTVLEAGTVESRGIGTNASSREQVLDEITNFLTGEGKLSFAAETRAFFTVWIFITRLPAPTWVDLHPGFLMRGMAFFPLAGMIVGILVSVWFDVSTVLLGLPPVVAAGISQAASFWATLCFHEDGLGDAADGLGGGWTRAQVLKIMTDTRLGTYGVCILILHAFLKFQLMGALGISTWSVHGDSSGAGPALVVMQTCSRLTAPFLIRTRNYVDEVGPKSPFYSFMVQAKYLVSWERVAFATLTCFLVASTLYGIQMAAVLILGVLLFAQYAGAYGEYRLGGVMGDYLGATICVTEILILVMILAKDSVMASWVQMLEAFRNSNIGLTDVLADAWQEPNTSMGVLIRFIVMIVLTKVWCDNVGFSSVPFDEPNEASTGTEATEESNGIAIPSARQEAESVCKSPDASFQERYDAVQTYLDCLAKPVFSLGTLEEWAARLAALQRTTRPVVNPVACLIFAADHGVAKSVDDGGEGCSLYPQAVTKSILVGLERGIAGASVLAKANNVSLRVVDVGVAGDDTKYNNIVHVSPHKLKGGGTANFCTGPAMTCEEVERCIRVGRDELAKCVLDQGAKAVVLGEVGIGNTTSSSALVAQLTDANIDSVCGGGATLSRNADQAAINKKVAIVKKALKLHGRHIKGGTEALARVGGAEIASLVGAMLEASERDVAILVDGFIVTAAALVAASISPNACRNMFFSSQSAEKGQAAAIESIQRIAASNGIPVPPSPALAMNLRMGEASAALLAVPILRSSVAILSEMGTIQDILTGN